jgi:hypothetical protein
MKVVFLSGTYIQAPEGKPDVRLGPGSYLLRKASECLFSVESTGKFDLEPAEAGKTPAKK